LLSLVILTGGRAGSAGLAAVSAMVLAHALPPDAMGVWAMALAVQGYALHLGELGLRSVVTAEAGRGKVGVGPLLRRYLGLRLTISAMVLALLAPAAMALAPATAPVVIIACVSILAAALQIDWLALANDQPMLTACLLLVRPLAFIVALLLWPGPLTPVSVALLFLAAWSVTAAVSWLALARDPPHEPAEPPPPRTLLRRGAPLCAVTLLNQALLSGDLLLAGAVLGAAAAGHYYVAAQIATAGLVLANAAGQAALARLARYIDEKDGFAAALSREAVPVLACGALLTALLLAVGPWLLPKLFGPAQVPAVPLLIALMPWFLLQHPTTLLQGALTAIGAGDRVLRANLLMLLALVPALALAACLGSAVLLALARGAGEAVRLVVLVRALPPDSRRLLLGRLAVLHPRPAA
jgi:O-antigen/teichoic acid export membrane protein